MSLRERIDYSLVLLLVSGLLAFVPLFDMWEDVVVQGKTPLSTLLENSIFVGLTLLLIGMSVWLLRNDWEDEYVQQVARWSTSGTVVVTLVYGWVLGLQLYLQNDLKPYIIAADGVVIGGIVLFVAGVYSARSRRENAARAAERDRFSALFDNTSDAIAAVDRGGDAAVFTGVNAPFRRAFDYDSDTLVGRPVGAVMRSPPAGEGDPPTSVAGPAESVEGPSQLEALVGDPDGQVELRREAVDGVRDFLVEYVPIGTASDSWGGPDGFLVFTDITVQKERERQLETLSEGTEGLLNARTTEGVVDALGAVTADLFADALVGVWTYDADAGEYDPRMGTPVPEVDLPAVPAGARRDDEGEAPVLDPDTVVETLDESGIAVAGALVGRLGETDRLVVCPTSDPLSPTERYLVDLLVANTRTALEQVERQETLTRRNDQLEFINSLLRHDIQNSLTVIRARGQAIAEATSGTHATYAETVVDQSDEVIELVDRFRALLDALADGADASLDRVSLSAVVDERVATLRTTYPEADVSVAAPADVTVVADDMVANVLTNVLSNAVEHNDTDEPQVTVSVQETEEDAVVRIADNGPGIPSDEREVVFRRGNRGLKEAEIGSGFGLFFVDTMMDRYGGSVRVEGNEPRGAVFVLTFPTA